MSSNREPTLLQMLESMRVAELQQILHYADQQRFGRKCMLLERCTSLLQSQGLNIEQKIKEVYHRRHVVHGGIPRPVLRPDRGAPRVLQNSRLVRPDVKFAPLAFYDYIGEILRPLVLYSNEDLNSAAVNGTEVRATPGNHRAQLQFYMSAQDAQDVATSRFWCEETKSWAYSLNIQLRFCQVTEERAVNAEDSLPPNLYVLMNSRVVTLPVPKPTSKPNSEVLRPGRPIDLTEHCRLSPTLYNVVEVGWSTGLSAETPLTTYCAAIFLVRKLDVQTLIRRLRLECVFNSEMTKSLIREKLNVEERDDSSGLLQIVTNTLHASILCPLSKCRIELPARTKNCRHVQCFDLQVFLRMNEKRPTWACPICDLKAPYNSLIIDWFFFDIIAKCPDVEAVEFDKDCNFTPVSMDVKPKKPKRTATPAPNCGNRKSNDDGENSDDVVILLSDDETTTTTTAKTLEQGRKVDQSQLLLFAKFLGGSSSGKSPDSGIVITID